MKGLENLFKGIVAIIDDDVIDSDSPINALAAQIEAEDCHVIKLPDHPSDARLNSLSEVAFFVLDWNLHDVNTALEDSGVPLLVKAPSTLSKSHIADNVEFIKKIRTGLATPIFIFTNENIDEVKGILAGEGLYTNGPRDNIFVQNKQTVLQEGVFKILTEWLQKHPSAYVLRKWESSYAETRKEFFSDFYEHSRLWPVVLWNTYSKDGVSEAAELTSVIGRNIFARLAPVDFDEKILANQEHADAATQEVTSKEIRDVLGGERFIKNERLQDQISVGDLFKKSGAYFINVRPECDCVARDGAGQDEVDLYLIKGDLIKEKDLETHFSKRYGNFPETDSTAVVFSIYEGNTVRFQMKNLRIEQWRNWKGHRIGRLIPPYSTKVQQKFGAYIQRVGLGRTPEHAIPFKARSSSTELGAITPMPVVAQSDPNDLTSAQMMTGKDTAA